MELNWIELPHRVYAKDDNGKVIAEISFPETAPGVCTIEEVYFDEDYRTVDEANALVEKAVKTIEGRGETVKAEHAFAKKWMKEHRS